MTKVKHIATFAYLRSRVDRLKDARGCFTDLGDTADDILDRARINADDTVFKEKSVPESEWDAIAYGTVVGILCERDDDVVGVHCRATAPQIRAWFRRIGVRY